MRDVARPQLRSLRFTILVEAVGADAWHLTVRELPETWTVAFDVDDIEARARQRIALDTGLDPSAVEIDIEASGLFVERRANRRDK